jgi:hypothetical protein
MIDILPNWINIFFLAAALWTIIFFYYSNSKSKVLLLGTILWSLFLSGVAYSGFLLNVTAIPPRYGIVVIPTIILIIYGLRPKQMQWVASNRSRPYSILLHTMRIPVELTLFWLFTYDQVPEILTYEGRNFDIIVGLTAPVVYLLYTKKIFQTKGLLVWNIMGICFLTFILANGILSAELPIQQFAFDQPNVAMKYFPYVLLPGLIVPLAWYTHITEIILLSRELKAVEE